jgi:hypothetical protein
MVGVVGAMVVGFLPLGLGVTAAGAAPATGGQYVPITPVRIADTRTGSTFPNAGQTMQAGGSVTVALPSSVAGASAVALNVTATNTTGSGFFTVYPAGGTLPLASSLNFSPGANVPNFVIVPVGANNSITIYNGPPGGNGSTGGAADAVVDLQGSFNTVANTSGGAGHFNPLTPARITDTRAGSGQTNAGSTLTAGGTLTVQATGKGGVPATGVSAVEVNVTEAANTAGGFLTVFPQGNTAPTVSNLNFVSGQIVANRVIVPVNPANGQFSIFNHAGNTDVVVDVDGYFTDSTGASGAGSLFNTVTPAPARVIDTRSSSPIGPNGNLNVPITGHNNVPAGASAAVLNVTEASNTAGGFLTISPTTPAPLASDVNFVPGVSPVDPKVIVANGDIAALASNGSLNVYNHDGNTNVVLDVAGYFTPSTPGPPPNQAYTVSGGSLAMAASTASATSQGATTYTVTGLPTASGTLANIALFPCFGTAQTGNGPTNGAPATSSSGSTTFTAPGGTTPVAGNAVGQGTSQSNSPAATPGFSTGSVPGFTASAYVASVNGVPTTNNGANNGPTQVYGLGVSNGTLSFLVNSFQLDCVIPVVYTAPSSAGAMPALLVNADGTPATGYAVGAGGPTAWSAPSAPASAGGYEVGVVLAPPLSGTGTFDGIVLPGSPSGTPGQIFSFQYANSGSTYFYTNGVPMSQTNWGADLSAGNGGQVQPNTSIAAPVAGDKIQIGTGGSLTFATGYASGAPASFAYDDGALSVLSATAFFRGDAPNTPTSPAATFNGCAFTVATVCTPGNVVTFTAPTNPDVSGSEAVAAGGGGFSANDASYQIWRSVDTGGTLSAPTEVDAMLSVVPGTDTADTDNGDGQGPHAATGGATSVSAPRFIDAGATAGAQYVYYVTATAAAAPNGGGMTSPFSAATNPVTAGAGAVTPVIKDVVITASQPFSNFNGNAGGGTFTSQGGVPATATVTYNETVNCLSAAAGDFSYSNSGGSGVVKGASCQMPTPTPSKQLVIRFAQVTKSGSGGSATFSQNTVVTPGNGDTVTYTVPSPETTANSVYAGSVGSPSYAATQTVTSNGTAASSSNALGIGTGVPVMGSATVTGPNTIAITYNEPPLCPTTLANLNGDFTYSNGGAPSIPAATLCGVVGDTMTITGWTVPLVAPVAGDTLNYTQNGPTAANAVHATDSITTAVDGGLSPQTLTTASTTALQQGPLS